MEFPWLLWFPEVSSAFLQRGKGCRSGNYIESTTLQGNFLPFFVFANFYFDHIWLSANIIQQWPRLVSDKGKYVRVGIMLPQSAVSNVRASQCEAGQSVFAHLRFTTRHCSSWQPNCICVFVYLCICVVVSPSSVSQLAIAAAGSLAGPTTILFRRQPFEQCAGRAAEQYL